MSSTFTTLRWGSLASQFRSGIRYPFRLSLLTYTLLSIFFLVSGSLSAQNIELTSQETLWLDANGCGVDGPSGAWLSHTITNPNLTALEDVVVTFSGFNDLGGTFADDNLLFETPSDLTRTFAEIGPGQTVPVYWYVDYSAVCTAASQVGNTAGYSVQVTSMGNPPVTYNGQVTTNTLIEANAAGLLETFTLGAGIVVGQVLELDVTYDFGNNDDLFFQPAGEAGFPDAAYRLIGSEITAVSGNVPTSLIGLKDQLHFPDIDVPSAGNMDNSITMTYRWEVIDLAPGFVINPWAAAMSGSGNFKYSGFNSLINVCLGANQIVA